MYQALVWFWGCDGKQAYHCSCLRALMVVEQETEEGIPGTGHGAQKSAEVGWRGGISQSSVCGGSQSKDGEREEVISYPKPWENIGEPQTSSSVQGSCPGTTGIPLVLEQGRSPCSQSTGNHLPVPVTTFACLRAPTPGLKLPQQGYPSP